MIEQMRFYLKHSLNDLRVNQRRTLFALLCIAAGVAAMVSLQSLGVMIQDALNGNLQEVNRADIRITIDNDGAQPGIDQGTIQDAGAFGQDYFSPTGLAQIQGWPETHYPGLVEQSLEQVRIVSLSLPAKNTVAAMIFEYMVDAKHYPLYGSVASEDGKALADLLQSPADMVINHGTADSLNAQIGNTLRVGDTDFTLRGIVPDNAEPGTANLINAIVGFYYVDQSAAALMGQDTQRVSTVYWRVGDPARTEEIGRALRADFPYLATTTLEDLRLQNGDLSGGLGQLVSVVGLLSLLIGGIGIVNTMQVIVSRRMLEVAVLKTLGLEGPQITILFLVEGFLMGLIGSIIGVMLGWGLTFIVKGATETFLIQNLTFRFTPGPAITGFAVGTLVTTVFGVLPTLSAGRVRPGAVLRPSETVVPKTGFRLSLAAMLVVIVGLIAAAWGVIGSAAAAVVPGAFIGVGLLYVILWAVIGLVGRFFPSFGSVDLKIALRSMRANRRRGASTLLALVIGVFTLSLVTIFATGVAQQFEQSMLLEVGGNVTVFAPAGTGTAQRLQAALAQFDSTANYAIVQGYTSRLVSAQHGDQTWTMSDLRRRVNGGEDYPDYLDFSLGKIDARDLNANLPQEPLYDGRALQPSDAGQRVIIISGDPTTLKAGISVGDHLTFELVGSGGLGFGQQRETVTFEVVGIANRPIGIANPAGAPNYAPRDAFPTDVAPSQVTAVMTVDASRIAELRRAVANIPGVFVVETSTFSSYINSILKQFSTFPMLVAALTLVVGGIVIANSVALSTMERRREIATLKAVGLQRERVLGILLLENAVLGLIGGLIGVGLGLVMVQLVGSSLTPGKLDHAIAYGPALELMLAALLMALAAALATAWGASGEAPLTVLRYE